MGKIQMGPQTLVYPMPALLVGANVDDKANFMTVAWAGIANSEPPMISVAIRHQRHTLRGIRQSMTFSVNVPSTDLVEEVDYCGMTSGRKNDKTEICEFKVFYGELNNAPLIEQCPVNLECEVAHILSLGRHALVIGKIIQTHVSEVCLTGGKPDSSKIRPFAYTPMPAAQYHALGDVVAKAFYAGRELKPKQ